MQHMVMKHGDQYESFYDHMTYPLNLYRTSCTLQDCGSNGKYLASNNTLIEVYLIFILFSLIILQSPIILV